MSGYYVRDYAIKTAQGSIAAAQTNAPISQAFAVTSGDSLNLRHKIHLSAAYEAAASTLKLQHSPGGDEYYDVGTAASIALVSAVGLADNTVTTADDDITLTSHPFETGDAVFYRCSGAGVITGLTDLTVYYVIDTSANDFQLATTRANALAGTAIALTQPSGGDNHSFTRIEYELILNVEDGLDPQLLPLYPKARWVATTGANATLTVENVYVTHRS